MRGSMFGQDAFVIETLRGQRGGFFLDSGASDGVKGSNTVVLEQELGWRGVCVEPNPAFFASLIRNRNCVCVNCCLYDRDGEVDFVEADVLGGILDEYHPRLLALATEVYAVPDAGAGRPTTVRRPARSVRSLLREVGAPAVIDYWSLDTEGSELSILRGFPFDEYAVRILTVEHNHYPARDEIRGFLAGHGYHVARELAVDDAFVRGDLVPSAAWRSAAWRR